VEQPASGGLFMGSDGRNGRLMDNIAACGRWGRMAGISPTMGSAVMLNDRENILTALREKPLKVYEIMKRANLPNEEACQSLLLKMRSEGAVKFDIHKGRWQIG
jgi:hypothetical protein